MVGMAKALLSECNCKCVGLRLVPVWAQLSGGGTPGPRSHAAEVMARPGTKASSLAALAASDEYTMRLMQARNRHEPFLQKNRPTRRQTTTGLDRGLPASSTHTLHSMCSAGIVASTSVVIDHSQACYQPEKCKPPATLLLAPYWLKAMWGPGPDAPLLPRSGSAHATRGI